jgi:4-hydroxy-L-threonine phosphate dehydrogenase PdxA
MSPFLLLTLANLAGIGPDLCLPPAREAQPHALIAIASLKLLAERAQLLGLSIQLIGVSPDCWLRPSGTRREPSSTPRWPLL